MQTILSSVSGPYQFENLLLFLLHGKDRLPAGTYRALESALEAREIVVHETGNVGQLLIENTGAHDVFVQAGDIVKGGRQDRVIGVDFLIGPGSGRLPIPTFCMEQGRWHKRGGESESQFGSSKSSLSGKAVKLSTKVSGSQSEVWDTIQVEQQKLAAAVRGSVTAPESISSYQLTLEHKKVRERIATGVATLRGAAALAPDSIGLAFAIADELNSADLYASHDLFLQLWDKLLAAAATEPISEATCPRVVGQVPVTAAEIEAFLETRGFAEPASRRITPRVHLREFAQAKKYRFETEDLERAATCVHTNVISR